MEDFALFCACFGLDAFQEALSKRQSHLKGHVSDSTVWSSFLAERNAGEKRAVQRASIHPRHPSSSNDSWGFHLEVAR